MRNENAGDRPSHASPAGTGGLSDAEPRADTGSLLHARPGTGRRLLKRAAAHPELGAGAGVVLVWVLFAVAAGSAFTSVQGTAAVLNAAAPLGILAIAVALLMIGGEFDLSIGSIIGAASMTLLLLTRHFGWPLWPAIACTVILSVAIGLANGLLVVRTGLPSFLVTLGTLFIFRGLTIAVTRLFTRRTQLGGLDQVPGYESARVLFGSNPVGPFRVSIAWWLGCAAVATWVLLRTRYGNWILGAGGGADAARRMGVPVGRVKVGLFVTTALAACLVAILQAVRFTGADALRGEQQEFRAIIAAVIGGTLLTGGSGSAIGAVFGALIFGMVQQGIVITGVDADWFQVFLGVMLVAAVVFNTWVRRAVAEVR
jgi:simple sugar transport system permease protein